MSNFAWVTLTTNDTYSLGALVLAHSLKRAGTVHQLAVLVTPGVSASMQQKLKDVYNVVQEVNVMDSQDAANLALLARPELGITFTKLHCWRLLQFEKCVFMDSDILVLQNCDELFEREELSAAPDVSWPDCFNSGVFVFKPNLDTFTKITEFALKHGSFDGGDQGLLNSYFSDWAHTDINKHLPFIYNVTAYASYCYLPAFKQFRDKIKILHFAGKMKPWLIQFDSQTRTACTPSEYRHATDLIQVWWNIFCDNVHRDLSDQMNYWPNFGNRLDACKNFNRSYYTNKEEQPQKQQQQQQEQQQQYENRLTQYFESCMNSNSNDDPWEDYYAKLRDQSKMMDDLNSNIESEDNFCENVNDEFYENTQLLLSNDAIQATNIIPENSDSENGNSSSSNSSSICESSLNWYKSIVQESKTDIPTENDEIRNNDNNYLPEDQTFVEQLLATQSIQIVDSSDCESEKLKMPDVVVANISDTDLNEYNATNDQNNENNQTFANSFSNIVPIRPQTSSFASNAYDIALESSTQAGLAGALATLRLGEKRTPEQDAYEQQMRRQCWESGQIDYTGRDSFDNIWAKITATLEEKPAAEVKVDQLEEKSDRLTLINKRLLDQAAAELLEHTKPLTRKSASSAISERLTSADIKDGKIEIDQSTGAKTQYKLIEGGYEMIITTPQQNGTMKTQVKTFYDPKPITAEELAKQNANKKIIKNKPESVAKLDKNTTLITREIPGGYEEVYTTVFEDGSKSISTKTFYDAVQEDVTDKKQQQVAAKKKTITSKTSLDESDEKKTTSTNKKLNAIRRIDSEEVDESRRMQKVETNKKTMKRFDSEEYNMKHESTFEETRRLTQKTELSGTETTSIRKSSIQEQSIKAISTTTADSKKDTKKLKKNKSIPPPPPDFIENDTTTVSSKKVAGGREYTYTTTLDSGKTITTNKTVYNEEEVDMTEDEINQYKKILKDAEKHKNVTSTKKLKSESGTKKIVPSENPGDVTTVETIKIDGGTEYHYTTVTAEGIVKKATKTIYDPVPTKASLDENEEEEEIVEEYEEEIIEPGEKVIKTFEHLKSLPKRFEEEVTITKEKKEKKVKKSMIISQ